MTETILLVAVVVALYVAVFAWGAHEDYDRGYDDGREDGWKSAKGGR